MKVKELRCECGLPTFEFKDVGRICQRCDIKQVVCQFCKGNQLVKANLEGWNSMGWFSKICTACLKIQDEDN